MLREVGTLAGPSFQHDQTAAPPENNYMVNNYLACVVAKRRAKRRAYMLLSKVYIYHASVAKIEHVRLL